MIQAAFTLLFLVRASAPVRSQSCVVVTVSLVVSSGQSLIRRASFFAAILYLIQDKDAHTFLEFVRWRGWQLTIQSLIWVVPEVFAIKLMAFRV